MWTTAVAPQKLVCRQAGLFGACSGPWGRGPGVWCLRPASRLCAVLASEHPLRARCPLPGSRPFRGAGASPTPREAGSVIPPARRRSSRAMIPRRLLLGLTIRRLHSRTSRAGSSQLRARRGADLKPPAASSDRRCAAVAFWRMRDTDAVASWRSSLQHARTGRCRRSRRPSIQRTAWSSQKRAQARGVLSAPEAPRRSSVLPEHPLRSSSQRKRS